jgi:hypothetical protein
VQVKSGRSKRHRLSKLQRVLGAPCLIHSREVAPIEAKAQRVSLQKVKKQKPWIRLLPGSLA